MRVHFLMRAILATIAITTACAQAQSTPQVKRTILLKQDMTLPGREAVVAAIELQPGSAEGRHTHPAELYVYLIEGEIVLESEGKADQRMKAGDVATVAPGKIHQALNRGKIGRAHV